MFAVYSLYIINKIWHDVTEGAGPREGGFEGEDGFHFAREAVLEMDKCW